MLQNQLDAEEFLKSTGYRIAEARVSDIIGWFKKGKTPYYVAITLELAAEHTVDKIYRHYKDGTLQPYLDYLDTRPTEGPIRTPPRPGQLWVRGWLPVPESG